MREEERPALLVADTVKKYERPLVKGVSLEEISKAMQREVAHTGGVVSGSGLKDKTSSL